MNRETWLCSLKRSWLPTHKTESSLFLYNIALGAFGKLSSALGLRCFRTENLKASWLALRCKRGAPWCKGYVCFPFSLRGSLHMDYEVVDQNFALNWVSKHVLCSFLFIFMFYLSLNVNLFADLVRCHENQLWRYWLIFWRLTEQENLAVTPQRCYLAFLPCAVSDKLYGVIIMKGDDLGRKAVKARNPLTWYEIWFHHVSWLCQWFLCSCVNDHFYTDYRGWIGAAACCGMSTH